MLYLRLQLLAVCSSLFVVSCAPTPLHSALFSESGKRNDLHDCIFVVNIEDAAPAEKLAASIAVGLVNQKYSKPTAVALNSPNDWKWVDNIRVGAELRQQRWIKASVPDFIAYAVSVGAARGIIQYRASETWSLANVVTLAGLERAIPIPLAAEDKLWKQSGEEPASANLTFHTDKVGSAPQYVPKIVEIDEAPPRGPRQGWGSIDVRLGLDVLGGNFSEVIDPFLGVRGLPSLQVSERWVDELDASLWAWFHLFERCQATDDVIVIQRPEVLQGGFLADYAAMRQLFVFFLPKMCSPGAQQILFKAMTEPAYAKGRQLKVMGYSIEDEVVADCSERHTEVSLVSDWCPNLSFYSLMQPIEAKLTQVPRANSPVYSPNDTYLAVINSDGDNMQMENNGNRDGMEARVKLCSEEGSVCPPLGWTISNHLASFAPFMLQWYYDQAQKTGQDTFLMGPSGYGFLHPAAIASNESLLDDFVSSTVEAAEQLSMTSYVHWDIDDNGLTQRQKTWLERLLEDATLSATSILQKLGLSSSEASAGHQEQIVPEMKLPAEQHALPLQVSRKLHMWQGRKTAEDVLKTDSRDADAASWSHVSSFGPGNSLARELFLHRFNGSPVNTVFAPGEYHIPDWIGNVTGIQEQFRWGKEETNLTSVIERFNNMPRGTIGYIYKIFEVDMRQYELLAQKIQSHVHLVDHRQLHDIAMQKKRMQG